LTRSVAFVEAWVRNADDEVVAQASATFAVRRRE
jgi:acyl-coenzyme A thioesterase PaaI-like protein